MFFLFCAAQLCLQFSLLVSSVIARARLELLPALGGSGGRAPGCDCGGRRGVGLVVLVGARAVVGIVVDLSEGEQVGDGADCGQEVGRRNVGVGGDVLRSAEDQVHSVPPLAGVLDAGSADERRASVIGEEERLGGSEEARREVALAAAGGSLDPVPATDLDVGALRAGVVSVGALPDDGVVGEGGESASCAEEDAVLLRRDLVALSVAGDHVSEDVSPSACSQRPGWDSEGVLEC